MREVVFKIFVVLFLINFSIGSINGQGFTGSYYTQNFDAGIGNWVIGGVTGNPSAMYDIFEHGKVTSSVYSYFKLDTTDLYIKTDMGGLYAQETHTWVTSPSFNFSSWVVPVLNVDIYANSLQGFHGACLKYSTDGNTWSILGSCGTGTGWYDNYTLSGDHCWANTGGAWVNAGYDLTFLSGYSQVYFKFEFSSGIIPTTLDGFAFDNFEVGETAGLNSPELTDWIYPLSTPCGLTNSESVTVELTNYGTQSLSGFYLRYVVNGNPSNWESVSTVISPGGSLDYTFNNTFNFSNSGIFNCTAEYSQDGITVSNSYPYDLEAEGLSSIGSFPFIETFSSGLTSYFDYNNGLYAQTSITSEELVMSGTGSGQYWSGGSFTTTSEMAWNDNIEYKSTIYNCHIDATNVTSLELLFDMWQDFSFGPSHSWFRVLINDIPIADVFGSIDHQLGTYESPSYHMLKYDLDAWAGSAFQVKFEAVNKLTNDIVKIDNIEVRERFPYDLEIGKILAPTTGCGLGLETIVFEFKNIGTSSASGFALHYSVNGSSDINHSYSGSIAPGATETFAFTTLYDFSSGGIIDLEIIWTSDNDQSNNNLYGYVVEDISNNLMTPYSQNFNAPNVVPADNWVIEDLNNDDETWGLYTDVNNNSHYAFDFEGAPGNDYLFTRCFNFEESIFYNLHFLYSTWIITLPQAKQLDVYLSSSQSASGIIGSPIVSFPGVNTFDQYQSYDGFLSVPSTGIYYLAFKVSGNATSEAEYILVDDLSLSRFVAPDLSITNLDFGNNACVMTNSFVNIDVTNMLGGVVAQGTSIEVTYSLNGNTPVTEFIFLTQSFFPGDIINYTFSQPVDLSAPGLYTILADVNYIYESNPFNDTNSESIIHYGYPDVTNVSGLDSGLCLNGPDITITGSFISQPWENPCVESFISGMTTLIDNGNGTATFSPTGLGSFPTTYTVTNTGGCATNYFVSIPITNPYVNLGPDICTYDYSLITLDGGSNPNYIFEWSTAETTQTIIPPFYGMYWVDATEQACTFRDSINVYIDQEIEFHLGWGIWSTYVDVNSFPSKDIGDVTSPLPYLVITKDEEGRFWWPAIPVNTIGDMINGEGYQYKMDLPDILYLCGDLLIPELTPITLKDGYNYIGYLRLNPSPVDYEMTQSGITGLVYVKDEDGSIYWPAFGLNLIGNFVHSKGYQVKMDITQPVDFYFSPN